MENEERQAIHPTALDEQEAVMTDEFLQQYEWQDADIEGNWLDPKEQYARPLYTLSYNGVPFAPLGGLHGLTGQPGHGKTFTFTQLMVAILKGEFYGLKYELSREIPSPKVLYIDTEMEKGNTQLVMLRVYEMMGWKEGSAHDEFKILWLREEVHAADRWRKVLKAIQVTRPTVVFLDGLIDVIGDFNDNKECQDIIYACMATASHYAISLWCLLHENPGSAKMVGHAGSFLERKATDVLKTKKDKESGRVSFIVAQIKARARDLDEWSFHIEDGNNKYGCPVIDSPCTTEAITKTNELKEKVKTAVLRIVWQIGGMRYKDIESEFAKQNITSHRMISDFISIAIKEGYIEKDDTKHRYFLLLNESATVDTQSSLDDDEGEPF